MSWRMREPSYRLPHLYYVLALEHVRHTPPLVFEFTIPFPVVRTKAFGLRDN